MLNRDETEKMIKNLTNEIVNISNDLRYSTSVELLYTGLLFNKYLDLLLARFGLNGARVAIIFTLLLHGGTLKSSDLVKFTLRSKQGISRIVDRLVKTNILSKQRDVNDNRSFEISITDHGVELARTILPFLLEAYSTIFSTANDEDTEKMKTTLHDVRRVLYKQLELLDSGKELVQ